MITVLSPLSGRVLPLADVPDPVFAQGMVGAGVAVEPRVGAGTPASPTIAAESSSADAAQRATATAAAPFPDLADEAGTDEAGQPVIGEIATAPISGRLMKAFPHAYILQGEVDVLVHLGIDTVSLEGAGFELLVEEGTEVAAGTPIIRWDPEYVASRGRPPMVLVVVPGLRVEDLDVGTRGRLVAAGDPLFDVP
nr:PTS glucose transporter subunit IIA [Actinomycetales bacterium]